MKYKKIGILISFAILSIFAVKAEAAAPTDGLMGYWAFDEGSGTVANDTSDNGNNGTINPVIYQQSWSAFGGISQGEWGDLGGLPRTEWYWGGPQ